MEEEWSKEERKDYFDILIEELIKEIENIEEGTLKAQQDLIKKRVEDFYEENKEYYEISSIDDLKSILKKNIAQKDKEER